MNPKSRKGVSTLPTMLLLGGIIIEIAIAVAFLTYYFNTLNFSSRLTAEALEAARAGADDAILKVVLNKNFTAPNGYVFVAGNGRQAEVKVAVASGFQPCSPDPANPASTRLEIDSVGKALNRNRQIRAVLSVDCLSGKTDTLSYGVSN